MIHFETESLDFVFTFIGISLDLTYLGATFRINDVEIKSNF